MAINFRPDDNYKVDGVNTIPRTYQGESLAYISDEEVLRLREKGGGVPPNDPSGQITKFGIPSFQGWGRTASSAGVPALRPAPAVILPGQGQPQPPTQVDKSLPPTPRSGSPYEIGARPAIQQGQLPPLTEGFQPVQQPTPITPGQAPAEPVDISTQQFPTEFLGNVLAGTETTPAFEFPDNTLGQEQEDIVQGLAGVDFTGREQPVFNPVTNRYTWEGNSFTPNELRENFGFPAVSDSSEPVDTAYGSFATQEAFDFFQEYLSGQFPYGIEEQPVRAINIEERNQRVLDIMSGQATSPVHPPGTKVELSPIQLQEEELLAEQQLGQIAPVVSDVAGAVPEIGVQGEFEAAQTEAARTEEIERARAARLTRENISAEVFVQEADVIGTVSEQSLAQAQADNLDPKATVQGQLENLYTSIIDGQPLPPWASGPVRVASQIMQQRGLGASSIAGAALVQAVQESAIPIAAADAQAYGTIQLQNLNNRHLTALQNALTFAQMDQRNQDARMRSAIQNSQNFLSIDVQNLNNDQQKEVLDFNTRAQEMFSNQAAANAASQFNAQSQNQIDQFFANLGTQVSQRNSELQVAQEQFNVDQVNTVKQFNQSLLDSRDKFNGNLTAQINQSNAVWRRTINTANNATQNEANRINAQNLLGLTNTAQNNLWQAYRDEAQWLVQTTENAFQRAHQAAILAQQQDFQEDIYRQSVKDNAFSAIGALAGNVIGSWLSNPDAAK